MKHRKSGEIMLKFFDFSELCCVQYILALKDRSTMYNHFPFVIILNNVVYNNLSFSGSDMEICHLAT